MIRQKRGRIINIGSQAGFVALPTESIYCMTKAAISHLTKCLAVEWGQHNITVNAVAPTFIRTPGTESCLANPEFHADVVERIAALHRIGEPMDVAGAVIFLASSAASLALTPASNSRFTAAASPLRAAAHNSSGPSAARAATTRARMSPIMS